MKLKIISWNVNGFRSITKEDKLVQLIRSNDPDIICLQEIKCDEETLVAYANQLVPELNVRYERFILGSTIPGRHGVAMFIKPEVLMRDGEYISQTFDGVDPLVDGQPEARFQMVKIHNTLFINTYSVNVRQDLSRISQRAAYDKVIFDFIKLWQDQYSGSVVLLGDLNVVADEQDYHGKTINPSMAGMTQSERDSFRALKDSLGMVDTYRALHPDDEEAYTYWSYRGYARQSNKGWRIDYAMVSKDLEEKILDAEILFEYFGSDHAPIYLEVDVDLGGDS